MCDFNVWFHVRLRWPISCPILISNYMSDFDDRFHVRFWYPITCPILMTDFMSDFDIQLHVQFWWPFARPILKSEIFTVIENIKIFIERKIAIEKILKKIMEKFIDKLPRSLPASQSIKTLPLPPNRKKFSRFLSLSVCRFLPSFSSCTHTCSLYIYLLNLLRRVLIVDGKRFFFF